MHVNVFFFGHCLPRLATAYSGLLWIRLAYPILPWMDTYHGRISTIAIFFAIAILLLWLATTYSGHLFTTVCCEWPWMAWYAMVIWATVDRYGVLPVSMECDGTLASTMDFFNATAASIFSGEVSRGQVHRVLQNIFSVYSDCR